MKKLSLLILFAAFAFLAKAQEKPTKTTKIEKKEVEISCGECMFKLPGKGCDLAVRIDGAAYFVDGKKTDDFGDAHAEDGFCNAIRKATVTGEIINGRFKAKTIQLLANKKSEKPKSK